MTKQVLTNEELKKHFSKKQGADDFTLANMIIGIVKYRMERKDPLKPVNLVDMFDEMRKNPLVIEEWEKERQEWYATKEQRAQEINRDTSVW